MTGNGVPPITWLWIPLRKTCMAMRPTGFGMASKIAQSMNLWTSRQSTTSTISMKMMMMKKMVIMMMTEIGSTMVVAKAVVAAVKVAEKAAEKDSAVAGKDFSEIQWINMMKKMTMNMRTIPAGTTQTVQKTFGIAAVVKAVAKVKAKAEALALAKEVAGAKAKAKVKASKVAVSHILLD